MSLMGKGEPELVFTFGSEEMYLISVTSSVDSGHSDLLSTIDVRVTGRSDAR